MAAKTPALALLERANAPFRVHEYRHDPSAASFGLEAAEKLGVEPARVFKTLVVDVDGKLVVAVVPVEAQLDLRALGKRAAMADPKLAERTTGYMAGGISPLGQRTRLLTLVDESALAFDTIFVSGGRRGLEIELAAADLVALTGAEMRTIANGSRRACGTIGTDFQQPGTVPDFVSIMCQFVHRAAANGGGGGRPT